MIFLTEIVIIIDKPAILWQFFFFWQAISQEDIIEYIWWFRDKQYSVKPRF